MSRSIRVSAKTVSDAVTEALIQLGVTSDMLEYNVIEKGSSGFLGIGMKQAVIDARKKEVVAEVEEEIAVTKIEPVKEIKETVVEPVIKKEAPQQPKTKVEEKVVAATPTPAIQEESTEAEKDFVKVEDHTVVAVKEFLQDTIKTMGVEVEIHTSVEKDGTLNVDLVGKNMGILIGKRGQTLDSLQYLANRVANKHQDGYVRIKLDTENYRARREETLERLARSLASKVKRTRRPVSLEPMNPYERRIIHSILQSDRFVSTHSEGEEPYRKVVITLKNNRRNY